MVCDKRWAPQIRRGAREALANPRVATDTGHNDTRATDMELAKLRGATNTGHNDTRATDMELAKLRGATTAGRYRHTCKMWNLQS